jgi:hypothetical protein
MPKRIQSSIAEAYYWLSIVTTITLEMVLPAWLGSWLDERWSTTPVLTIIGAGLGMLVSITHLIQITNKKPPKDSGSSDSD